MKLKAGRFRHVRVDRQKMRNEHIVDEHVRSAAIDDHGDQPRHIRANGARHQRYVEPLRPVLAEGEHPKCGDDIF